jgi:hypothetical protein
VRSGDGLEGRGREGKGERGKGKGERGKGERGKEKGERGKGERGKGERGKGKGERGEREGREITYHQGNQRQWQNQRQVGRREPTGRSDGSASMPSRLLSHLAQIWCEDGARAVQLLFWIRRSKGEGKL